MADGVVKGPFESAGLTYTSEASSTSTPALPNKVILPPRPRTSPAAANVPAVTTKPAIARVETLAVPKMPVQPASALLSKVPTIVPGPKQSSPPLPRLRPAAAAQVDPPPTAPSSAQVVSSEPTKKYGVAPSSGSTLRPQPLSSIAPPVKPITSVPQAPSASVLVATMSASEAAATRVSAVQTAASDELDRISIDATIQAAVTSVPDGSERDSQPVDVIERVKKTSRPPPVPAAALRPKMPTLMGRPVDQTMVPTLPSVIIDASLMEKAVVTVPVVQIAVKASVPPLSAVVPTLTPVRVKALSIPPSPVVRREPRRIVRRTLRVAAVVVAAGGLMIGSAFAATWAVSVVRAPEAMSAPGPEADSLPAQVFSTTSSSESIANFVHPVSTRAAHERSATVTPPAVNMSGRPPVLPPPRRSSAPSRNDSVDESASQTRATHAPQSCGERCQGNIDCLLSCHSGSTNSDSTSGSSNSDPLAAAVPTREQIMMAMARVRGAVIVCGMGVAATAERTAMVTVTFDSSGQADHANVAAPYAGTATGSCIATAVERAHVPPFTQSNFRVTFPFSVH